MGTFILIVLIICGATWGICKLMSHIEEVQAKGKFREARRDRRPVIPTAPINRQNPIGRGKSSPFYEDSLQDYKNIGLTPAEALQAMAEENARIGRELDNVSEEGSADDLPF
jgi:hypothetical protein